MSSPLDDPEFEEWLLSNDLTIDEFIEWKKERERQRTLQSQLVHGAYNTLLAPGLHNIWNRVYDQGRADRSTQKDGDQVP